MQCASTPQPPRSSEPPAIKQWAPMISGGLGNVGDVVGESDQAPNLQCSETALAQHCAQPFFTGTTGDSWVRACAACRRKSSRVFIASAMSLRASRHGVRYSFSMRYNVQKVLAVKSARAALLRQNTRLANHLARAHARAASNACPPPISITETTPDSTINKWSLTSPAGRIISPAR